LDAKITAINVQSILDQIRLRFPSETLPNKTAIRERVKAIADQLQKIDAAIEDRLRQTLNWCNATTHYLERLETILKIELLRARLAYNSTAAACAHVIDVRIIISPDVYFDLLDDPTCAPVAMVLARVNSIRRQLNLVGVAKQALDSVTVTIQGTIAAGITKYQDAIAAAAQAVTDFSSAVETQKTSAARIALWESQAFKDRIVSCLKALGNGAVLDVQFTVTARAAIRVHKANLNIDLSVEGVNAATAATIYAGKLQACVVAHTGETTPIESQATGTVGTSKRAISGTSQVTATQETNSNPAASAPAPAPGSASSFLAPCVAFVLGAISLSLFF